MYPTELGGLSLRLRLELLCQLRSLLRSLLLSCRQERLDLVAQEVVVVADALVRRERLRVVTNPTKHHLRANVQLPCQSHWRDDVAGVHVRHLIHLLSVVSCVVRFFSLLLSPLYSSQEAKA